MEKSKTKLSKNTEKSEKIKQVLLLIIKSTFIFLITILLGGAICYVTDIGYDNYSLIFIALSVISAFISGFIYSRKMKKNGILHGTLAALPIAAETIAASVILSKGETSVMLFIAVISILLSGAISGSFGVNSRR